MRTERRLVCLRETKQTLCTVSIVILLVAQFFSRPTLAAKRNQDDGPAVFWLSSEKNLSLTTTITEAQTRLASVLDRVGPNIRASSDYHDYSDIKLEESIEAWKLLHDRAQQFARNQVNSYKPKLQLLLKEANASQACQESAEFVLHSMQILDSWSVQMWSSTGNFPPVGLIDGQFSDMGSYRSCVDMSVPQNSRNNATSGKTGFTSYCSLAFRPILPSRPRFHQIFERLPEKLRDSFGQTDFFTKILQQAQYFHYIYMKTGVCVPHQCSAQDLQQVAIVLGHRFALMSGPVKCFTRAPTSAASSEQLSRFSNSIENQPISVQIRPPMNLKQVVSFALLFCFFGLVLVTTIWHAAERRLTRTVVFNVVGGGDYGDNPSPDNLEQGHHQNPTSVVVKPKAITTNNNLAATATIEYGILKHVAFDYFSLITNTKEFLDTSMRSNEIKCLHGFRVLTMLWIITVHTMQFNDWSQFTRIFEITPILQNPALHPIYNANYVVDNFFFMSGLLAAYTTWNSNYKRAGLVNNNNFIIVSSLVGRYLRLTPQVFLVALLYILLPLIGDSPYWFDTIHHASKSCERNWWINLLHLQSFYKTEEICNLVSWWISVDMFFYLIAVFLLYMMLNNKLKQGLILTSVNVGFSLLVTAHRHYQGGFTPNNLGTVPQIGEVWTSYVVYFYFSPYSHAFPFFSGLWAGYALANNKWRRQIKQWSRFGWSVVALSMLIITMSSHLWMSGTVKLDEHGQWISTAYNTVCTIVWVTSFAWIIGACHYGCAPKNFNKLFSCQIFVLLSKASYMIYLSHMLVLQIYFGLQNTLLEVSVMTFSYAIIGNIFISAILGMFLCVSFERPSMKFQKFVLQKIKSRGHLPLDGGANYDTSELNAATSTTTNQADRLHANG